MIYTGSDYETSALLRQFIFNRARRISRQITQAAEEIGTQAAERRRHLAAGEVVSGELWPDRKEQATLQNPA